MAMKTPKMLEQNEPTILVLDPSLRATGWAILSLRTWDVLAMGVVVTKSASEQKKMGLRQTKAEADLRSGTQIFTAISSVIRKWRPIVAVQEGGSGGSKSVAGAKALARSQQACGDAVYRFLRTMPIMVTVQACKKAVCGRNGASKDEVEKAVRAIWARTDLEALLKTPPPYLEQGQRLAPKGKWENAFDALAVAHCARDNPTVAAARKMAA